MASNIMACVAPNVGIHWWKHIKACKNGRESKAKYYKHRDYFSDFFSIVQHLTPNIPRIVSKLKYESKTFRNNSHSFKKISLQVRASHFTNLKFCACETKIWCTSASNISPTFIAVSYKLGWRFFNFISSMVALETFTFFDLSPHFNIAHKIIFTFFFELFRKSCKTSDIIWFVISWRTQKRIQCLILKTLILNIRPFLSWGQLLLQLK